MDRNTEHGTEHESDADHTNTSDMSKNNLEVMLRKQTGCAWCTVAWRRIEPGCHGNKRCHCSKRYYSSKRCCAYRNSARSVDTYVTRLAMPQ